MQFYKSINQKKTSKAKKLIIVLITVIALFLIFLGIIGAIANSDSAENQNVSAAVAENVELKQKISELEQQLEDMQAQIESLNGELSVRPTIEPTPYAPTGEMPVPTATIVPR